MTLLDMAGMKRFSEHTRRLATLVHCARKAVEFAGDGATIEAGEGVHGYPHEIGVIVRDAAGEVVNVTCVEMVDYAERIAAQRGDA